MLLFDPIYDAIIEVLASKKSLPTKSLYELVVQRGSLVSLPNFYKIISRLVSDQILIKDGGKLSIHGRWILELIRLSEKLGESRLGENSDISELQEGESFSYSASSLKELDGLWGDLMISVNKICGPKEITYVYQAHPYYALGMPETELSFFRQELSVSPVYFLAGNTGFLDNRGLSLYESIDIPSFASDNVPFPREGYCLTVIGDYIFEVIYPQTITNYFQLLFETTNDAQSFNPELFKKIFEMREKCRLVLRRNKKHAMKVREGFLGIMETTNL